MKEPIRAVAGGVAVGIANVIPGVSGGTMMAIMNIFDRTMNAISDLPKKDNDHRFKDILFLLEVVVGAVIGILGFSWLLEKLFTLIPMPTVFWFVGLVALSVPVFKKQQMPDCTVHWGGLAVGAVIIAALTVAKIAFFPDPADQEWELPAFSLLNSLLLTGAGAIAGFAMLLPGVSGSLMLMIFGLYETVYFAYINNITVIFTDLSMETILKFVPLGFFAVGTLIGIWLSARVTAWALAKNKRFTLSLLLGLVFTSALSVIAINYDIMTADVWMIVGSVVAFALGGVIVLGLGKVTAD